ncbi:MAG: hypothetical protein KBC64_01125 [Simkaniaceae bacterium]|nr:hypothetical protein [Simkaniaceae bacterium]
MIPLSTSSPDLHSLYRTDGTPGPSAEGTPGPSAKPETPGPSASISILTTTLGTAIKV